MTRKKTARLVTALVAIVGLAGAISAHAQSAVNRKGRNLFSKQQDIEIGHESAKDAEKEFPLLRQDEVQRYVADLGGRLAQHAPGYPFPYSFKVVDVADINAFALPGGPVYINRGTIEQARSEGELAGVIAHEISHVDLRHGTRQATKAFGAQLALSVVGGLIGSGATTRQIIDVVGGFSLQSVLLQYGREAETDSDILGSLIMSRAGYDPKEMATFFDLLAQQSPRRTAEFFSSHPAPERRRERIEQESALLGPAPPPASQDRFRAIQARLRALPPAPTMEELAKGRKTGSAPAPASESARQLPDRPGRVPPPSRSLAWFDSPSRAFRVAHPDNWQVVSQAEASVTLAAPGGAWRTAGGVEISHGIMVLPHGIPRTSAWARQSPLEAGTADFLAAVERESPYLRATPGGRRAATVDGGEARVTTLQGTVPGTGRQERVSVVTTVARDGELLALLYVVPGDAPGEYDALFEAVLRNLRVSRR